MASPPPKSPAKTGNRGVTPTAPASREQDPPAKTNSQPLFTALPQNYISPAANKSDQNKAVNTSPSATELPSTAPQRPVATMAGSGSQSTTSGTSQFPSTATAPASPLAKAGEALATKPFSNFQFSFDSGIGHLWDFEAYLLRPFFKPPVPGDPIMWQYMLIRLPVGVQDIRAHVRLLGSDYFLLVSMCDLLPEEWRLVMEKVDERKAQVAALHRMPEYDSPTTIGVFKVRSFIVILKTPIPVNQPPRLPTEISGNESFQSFVAHPPFNDKVSPEEVRFIEQKLRQNPSTWNVFGTSTDRPTWGGASHTQNAGGSGLFGASNGNPQGFGAQSSNFVASSAPVATGRRFGDPYPQVDGSGHAQPPTGNTSSLFGAAAPNHGSGFGFGHSPGLFGGGVRHGDGFGSGSTSDLSGGGAPTQGGLFGSGNYSGLFRTAAPSQGRLFGTGNSTPVWAGAPPHGSLFGGSNTPSLFGAAAANNGGGGFGSSIFPNGLFGKVSGDGVNQNTTDGDVLPQSGLGSGGLFGGLGTQPSSAGPSGSRFPNTSSDATVAAMPQGGSGVFGSVAGTPTHTGTMSATPSLFGAIPRGAGEGGQATIRSRPCHDPSHHPYHLGHSTCPGALQSVQSKKQESGSLFANPLGHGPPPNAGFRSLFGYSSKVPPTGAWIPTDNVLVPSSSRATTPGSSSSTASDARSKSPELTKSLPAKPQPDEAHSARSTAALKDQQGIPQSKSNTPSKPSEKAEVSKSEGNKVKIEDVEDEDHNAGSISKV